MTRRIIENDRGIHSKGANQQVTVAGSPEMDWSQSLDLPRAYASKPTLTSHHSSSLPSTPYQRPRDRNFSSRSPSPGRSIRNASPRSSHSDSNHALPALRKSTGGCKYETGMAQAKRRVPYSLGPEKLGPELCPIKAHLNPEEDGKLSADMRELYDRLLPSLESEERRTRFIQKLEGLLNEKWPGYTIKVNVFGSTGNKLGTTDSDVDICITTDSKDLEYVCSLAEVLASHGMERVVCVSSAKVPIVKVWDPELCLACDMNVNNPIALENTDMIRTYVAVDDRVRPLAMIIKHWARRRILNDAALGSTLSSYTWICMIINFLQTRSPPVLPNLQRQLNLKPRIMNGINVAFDKNVKAYRGFGAENKESLGQLLFQFFRYYGHEVDFEESVMSVRLGKIISKAEKGWHLLQDNRLCVEEPFNVSRNLGNTADDTSMRGIHLELRRAFKMIAQGDLEKCCEQYEHPLDEGKTFEKFIPPESRPVVAQMPAQSARGGRGGGRGGRHANQYNRASQPTGRRASNPASRIHPSLRHFPHPQMTQQELQLHAQQQQFLLHDQLYQQYQYLQAQEQELRMQLQQQALVQGRVASSLTYPHIPFPSYATQENNQDEIHRPRAETVNHPPFTAPMRQQRFPYAASYLTSTMPRVQGPTTNPPSPLLRSAFPDRQRTSRRASLTNGSVNTSLRAHSQPARPIPSPLSFHPTVSEEIEQNGPTVNGMPLERRPSEFTDTSDLEPEFLTSPRSLLPQVTAFAERRPSEYIGYYVGHSPPLPAPPHSSLMSPVQTQTGLAIQNGGLSPRLLAQIPSYQSSAISPPSERVRTPRTASVSDNTGSLGSPSVAVNGQVQQQQQQSKDQSSGPLVVNGSVTPRDAAPEVQGDAHDHNVGMTFSASTSEDLAFDTPTSSEDQSQGVPESVDQDIPDVVAGLGSERSPENEPDILFSTRQAISKDENAKEHGSAARFMTEKAEASLALSAARPPDKVATDPDSSTASFDAKRVQVQTNLQLSPVKEARTPSPSRDHQVSPITQSKLNGASFKLKGKGRSEKSAVPGYENQNKTEGVLAAKPNGSLSTPPVKNSAEVPTSNSGWQTQKKKKHRKASKSEGDVGFVNVVGGDSIPSDEALRKGG